MSDDDEVIVVCMTVAEARGKVLVEGASEGRCEDCGAAIIVSPSSRGIAAGKNHAGIQGRLVCTICGYALISEDDDSRWMPRTREQLDEQARHQEHHA